MRGGPPGDNSENNGEKSDLGWTPTKDKWEMYDGKPVEVICNGYRGAGIVSKIDGPQNFVILHPSTRINAAGTKLRIADKSVTVPYAGGIVSELDITLKEYIKDFNDWKKSKEQAKEGETLR